MAERSYAWRVEATTPDSYDMPDGSKRPTTNNINVEVIAKTIDDVLDAVRHRYRDTPVTFIKVMRQRHLDDVIVADNKQHGGDQE